MSLNTRLAILEKQTKPDDRIMFEVWLFDGDTATNMNTGEAMTLEEHERLYPDTGEEEGRYLNFNMGGLVEGE
jgi:hypothetical protein